MKMHTNFPNFLMYLFIPLLLPLTPVWAAAEDFKARIPEHIADWTVMLYLNGADDLQIPAQCVILQLLSAKSTSRINIIGLLALSDSSAPQDGSVAFVDIRCKHDKFPRRAPTWNGVRRFQILASSDNGEPFVSTFLGSANSMRNPATLTSFVKWSTRHLKAKHYILIMKDHGIGAPFFQLTSAIVPKNTDRPSLDLRDSKNVFVKPDDNLLLNIQISRALKRALGRKRLDILGFDSCYKAMLEAAFEMRPVARVLVASEAIQFDYSWDYNALISLLARFPDLDHLQVAAEIVRAFAILDRKYPVNQPATLSSTDLDALDAILNPLNIFAQRIIDRKTLWERVVQARRKSPAHETNDVDIEFFLRNFIALGDSADQREKELINLAYRIREEIDTLLDSYYNEVAVKKTGSTGMAIYFPECVEAADLDPNQARYDPSTHDAIPFAKRNAWATFVREYLAIGGLECPPDDSSHAPRKN
jgi:hypothetical protein